MALLSTHWIPLKNRLYHKVNIPLLKMQSFLPFASKTPNLSALTTMKQPSRGGSMSPQQLDMHVRNLMHRWYQGLKSIVSANLTKLKALLFVPFQNQPLPHPRSALQTNPVTASAKAVK